MAETLLVGTELKPSSTWKCPRRKSEASSKLLSESFCCLMLAELEGVATPGDNAAPKNVYIHSVFNNWFCEVVAFGLQEAQKVPVLRVSVKAVKHLLNVTSERNFFFSKSCQQSDQGIKLIRTLE